MDPDAPFWDVYTCLVSSMTAGTGEVLNVGDAAISGFRAISSAEIFRTALVIYRGLRWLDFY